MGYEVDYGALENQLSAFENAVSGWRAEISSVMSAEAAIEASTNISGNKANRIRAYLSEAYPHMNELFTTLLDTFSENFRKYLEEYKQQIDCSGDTHIEDSELSERSSSLKEKRSKLQELGVSVETAISGVSDIAAVTSPDFSVADAVLGNVCTSIDELDSDINALESAHSSGDFGDIDALISKLSSYFDGIGEADWGDKSTYVAGSATSFALLLSTGIVLYDYAEYAASGGTTPRVGQIRYVYQCGSDATKQSYGWGDIAYKSGKCCNAAVGSMALSYMGIDKSPESLNNDGVIDISTWRGDGTNATNKIVEINGRSIIVSNCHVAEVEKINSQDISERVQAFMQDNGAGKVSPVMLRYTDTKDGNNVSIQHFILLVSQNEDGSYYAIDPGSNQSGKKITTVTIGDNGEVKIAEEGYNGGKTLWVNKYGQYTEIENADSSTAVSVETSSATYTSSGNCGTDTESESTAETETESDTDNRLAYSRPELTQDNAAYCPVQE